MTRTIVPLLLLLLACSATPGDPAQLDTMPAGERLFRAQCVLCHGNDGKLGLSGAKDLTRSELTREEMIALVSQGKGAMMAYRNVLRPAEIEAVVDHVRSLKAADE